MAGKYSAHGDQNLSSSTITALHVVGASTTRGFVKDVVIGNSGTPADLTSIHTCQRITAAGTSTAVTPTKLDLADGAAECVCGENHTAEPTYTANTEIWEIPLNHRATFRWVAAPGMEIVLPATANAGVGFSSLHASATTLWDVTAMWEE